MEKFTVLGPFTTDPPSPGFPGFGSVSVPNSHLPSQHLRHTNCSCSLQEKAGSSKTQTAVIITLSTSFLELVLRSRWELIRFKLPLTLPFLLGFSHSSHSYVTHEERFNLSPGGVLQNGTGEGKNRDRALPCEVRRTRLEAVSVTEQISLFC